MRKCLYVKKISQRQECTGEDVILFKDENGKSYLWFTKSTTSKISLIEEGEWINITASIKGYNSDNTPILKYVKLTNKVK